jgi:hypothetical protein
LNCNVSPKVVDNNTHHLLELTELYQYTRLGNLEKILFANY